MKSEMYWGLTQAYFFLW